MVCHFGDSKAIGARERHLVLKSWRRFLKSGLRFEGFSQRLYKHLTLGCGFIPHHDRHGFYATYFNLGEEPPRFLFPVQQKLPFGRIRWFAAGWRRASGHGNGR